MNASMSIGKLFASLMLLSMLLVGCSTLSASDLNQDETQISLSPDESSVLPDKQDTARSTNIGLAERINKSGVELPDCYIDIVEENTKIGQRLKNYDVVEFLTYSHYEIVRVQQEVSTLLAINEYHVFENGAYKGFFDPGSVTIRDVEPVFRELDNHVWIALTTYSGHGTGYSRYVEKWYELSDQNLSNVLSFGAKHELWLMGMYPQISTKFYASVSDLSTEQAIDSERYIISITWDEYLFTYTNNFDSNSNELPLFFEEGIVTYRYYEGNEHYPPSFSNYSEEPSNEVSVEVYNEGFAQVRTTYNLLENYMPQILELSKNGTPAQKQWLSDYLADINILQGIHDLYEWSEAYAK